MTDSNSVPAAAAAAAAEVDATTTTSTSTTASTLSKPAHTKLASSYYYFSSTPTHQASQYMPQLISTSPAPTAAATPSPTPIDSSSATSPAPPSSTTSSDSTASASSATPALPKSSAWNAAGTWEERDVSSWARTRLQALVLELAFPPHDHVRVSIESVKSCTGDASIIFTRGKKKVGFDLQFEAEWVGKHGGGGGELKGTLHVSGIHETAAGDYEITIKPSASSSSSGSNEHKEVIQFVHKHGKTCTASVIDRFVEDLMRH